jgi:hypothetical protein
MQEEEATAGEEQSLSEDTQPTGKMQSSESGGGEPSRIGQWLRQSLRWLAGMGFVFLLGVLVVFFVRVRPQADTIKGLRIDLQEAEAEVVELKADLDRLVPLEEENRALEEELAAKDRHLDLLAILVDVTRAQLALAQDLPGEARASLEATDARLADLERGVEEADAETVGNLRDRLSLVLEEIESDAFAAERDLEILSNNIVDLVRDLFE